MSLCQFNFRLKVPPADLVGQIRQLTQEYNGTFDGDEQTGRLAFQSILGNIEGDYTIAGDQVQLTITKKPFLLGCDTISATIKEYLKTLA